MNNDQNNRTNRDQEQAAEQSARGNREHDMEDSGPMTDNAGRGAMPGTEADSSQLQARSSSDSQRAESSPINSPSERSPSQENL